MNDHRIGVKNMTSGLRITYRFTYDQLVRFLEEISRSPPVSVREMKNWNRDRWVFAHDAALVKEDRGVIVLSGLGEDFLKQDKNGRQAIFRSILLRIDQFVSIWSKVEARAIEQNDKVTKEDIRLAVVELTGTVSPKMAKIYRSRITNWAKNAGLLSRVPGERTASYRVRGAHSFGPMVSVKVGPAEQDIKHRRWDEETAPASGVRLGEINIVVCDLLTDPDDRRLLEELVLLTAKWKHKEPETEISELDKKIIINELTAATAIGGLRAFQMVAQTLKIIRRERLRQRTISEFQQS
jgi:hypothetical protein